MYQWEKPELRCRRIPSGHERDAGFLDARGMTQLACEPRKVWRVRAESVLSVGRLVQIWWDSKNGPRMRRYDVGSIMKRILLKSCSVKEMRVGKCISQRGSRTLLFTSTTRPHAASFADLTHFPRVLRLLITASDASVIALSRLALCSKDYLRILW